MKLKAKLNKEQNTIEKSFKFIFQEATENWMSEMSETTVNIRGDKQSTSQRIWSGLSMSAEYFDLLVALSLCTTNTIFIKELDQYQHKWVNFKTTSIYLTAGKNKKNDLDTLLEK